MSVFRASHRRLAQLTAVFITTISLAVVGTQAAHAALSDGTIDTTFNVGGAGFTVNTNAIAVQPDGKILVGGNFTTYNELTANRLIRLNTDGTVDPTFVTGSGLLGAVNVIHLLADGSILVGGQSFTSYNGAAISSLIKLTSTGLLDTTFSANVGTLNGQVSDIETLADGNYVATGQFTGGIIKFDSTGVKNSTFTTNLSTGFSRSTGGAQTVYSVVQQASGDLVLAGLFDRFQGNPIAFGISKISNDGTLVSSFQSNAGAGLEVSGSEGYGSSVVQLSTGKLVVGGNFSTYAGASAGNIVGLNADGTRDTSFNTGGSGFNNQVNSITVDSSENLLVAQQVISTVPTYNGAPATQLARISKVGVLDTSFSAPFSSPEMAFKTLPVSSGEIYVAGTFTTFRGVSVGRFMRLTTGSTPNPEPNPNPQPSDATNTATLAATGSNALVPAGIALATLLLGGVLFTARRRMQ